MLKKMAILGAMSMLMSGTALAADIEAPPAAYDWSGFYIGALAGYAWSDFDVEAPIPNGDGFDRSQSFDVDGGIFGVEVGWNHQMDAFVLGVAADISYLDADDDSVYDTIDEDEFYVGEMDWLATVRAKAGYALDNVLIYATGGLAITDATLKYEDRDDVDDFAQSESDTLFGWTIGAGLEVGVTETISVKAEYLYVDFETLNGEFDIAGTDRDIDIDTQILRGGVSFRF